MRRARFVLGMRAIPIYRMLKTDFADATPGRPSSISSAGLMFPRGVPPLCFILMTDATSCVVRPQGVPPNPPFLVLPMRARVRAHAQR